MQPDMLRDVADVSEAKATRTKGMVRTQIYLTRAEHDFLQEESAQRGEPMAAVLRAFIDEKMALPTDVWTNNPMLRAAPESLDEEGPTDGAINHDHYLAGTPKKWVKTAGKWEAAPPLPDDYYDNDASYEAYHRQLRQFEQSR